MPNVTTVERFPKVTNTRAQVEGTAQGRIAAGAISSVVTEETDNWVLTTVLPDPDAPDTSATVVSPTTRAGRRPRGTTAALRISTDSPGCRSNSRRYTAIARPH